MCDYHSPDYDANNPHSSAQLANYLVDTLHKKDMEEIDYYTIARYSGIDTSNKLREELGKKLEEFKKGGRVRR